MSEQKKIDDRTLFLDNKALSKIKNVLDLEKKYFSILRDTFTSPSFIEDLENIEEEIISNYSYLKSVWQEKNKLKIPAERLARQYVYRELSSYVKHIYPSPVSSDIAFITNDAVINIDVKTLDVNGNKGDIQNLQFESNQSSFINKNIDADKEIEGSGVKPVCYLPTEYSFKNSNPLPVLTYFLTIVYRDDTKSFSLYRPNKKASKNNISSIYLKCLPNGILSVLFENDIISNFKTYNYFEAKNGLARFFLTDSKNNIMSALNDFIKHNSGFQLFESKTNKRTGLYNKEQIHPIFQSKGVTWFPVERKTKTKKAFYLEAVNRGHTIRVPNNIIKKRYDSKNIEWEGIKTFNIPEKNKLN